MISLLRNRLLARAISVSGFKKAGELQFFTGIHNGVPFEVCLREGVTMLSCTHIQTHGELWYYLCHDDVVTALE